VIFGFFIDILNAPAWHNSSKLRCRGGYQVLSAPQPTVLPAESCTQ